jgi:hypothetical protein
MTAKKTILFSYLLGFLLICACATGQQTVKPDLDKFFEKKLQSIAIPPPEQLKQAALSNNYPHITYDEVWDSAIKILMQNGIIIKTSKKTGMIVAISDMVTMGPEERARQEQFGMFKPITPLSNTIYLLVEDYPNNKAVTVFLKSDKPISKTFFDRLSTQVYAGKKWNYLSKK